MRSTKPERPAAKPGQQAACPERATPPRTQLTVAETAGQLGVSTRVIHSRIRAGLIPAVKLPGATNPYLIDADVVEELAALEAADRAHRDERREKRRDRRAARIAASSAA